MLQFLFAPASLVLSFFIFLSVAKLAVAEPVSVKAAYQNSQPKYFANQPEKGLCGDIYASLAKRVKDQGIDLIEDQIEYPIKRILSNLDFNRQGIFCGAGRNKEREERFIYSSVPVYHVSNIVIARKDDPYDPQSIDGLTGVDLKVGAYFGTSSARFLMGHEGVRVLDHFTSLQTALEDVAKGGIRYFYYHDLGLLYLLRNSDLPLRAVPTKFRTVPQWIIYSKKLEPEVIRILDEAVIDMVKSGEIEKIWDNYKPHPN